MASVEKSMLCAPLWHLAEKGKPVPPKIPNVQRLLGTDVTKSRVVPAAAGVTGDFKTVEQQDPLLASQTITIKATRIAALVHKPLKRFLEIDINMIVINGNIFEYLDPEMMCAAWLYEEMACADTLICGSQTVVDNMYDALDTEAERRLIDDFNAPRIGSMLCIPIFSWPTKLKAAGDLPLFDVRWLLILAPDSWCEKVKFRRCVLSLREASRNNFSLFADSELDLLKYRRW